MGTGRGIKRGHGWELSSVHVVLPYNTIPPQTSVKASSQQEMLRPNLEEEKKQMHVTIKDLTYLPMYITMRKIVQKKVISV